MANYLKILCCVGTCIILSSCSTKQPKGTYGYDLNFLKKHQEVITLEKNNGKSQLILLPELQYKKGMKRNKLHYKIANSPVSDVHHE